MRLRRRAHRWLPRAGLFFALALGRPILPNGWQDCPETLQPGLFGLDVDVEHADAKLTRVRPTGLEGPIDVQHEVDHLTRPELRRRQRQRNEGRDLRLRRELADHLVTDFQHYLLR